MIKILNSAVTLFLAGSFLFAPFGRGKVKEGVVIEGEDVGGLTYAVAETRVREKIAAELLPFSIITPSGEVSASLSFTDDVARLVRKAKRGENLTAAVTRVWVNAEKEMEKICAEAARPCLDASFEFSAEGFVYKAEQVGVMCDYAASLHEALSCLQEGKSECTLRTAPYEPKVTLKALREQTTQLSSFTTYFSGAGGQRAKNIALAARRISGTILQPNEEFSFNAVVGKRTRENGFGEAAVIFDGQFVQGVGGGVCQTSTTLMNAALRAGLKITESRPHSLSVGYVPPSLDAMVSEYSDLKIVNPHTMPVYILSEMGSGSVTFRIFGLPDGRRYETESRVLLRVPPPEAEVVEGEKDEVLRAEKEGLVSESYLLIYEGEKCISRKLLRRDAYAVVRGKVSRKTNSQLSFLVL